MKRINLNTQWKLVEAEVQCGQPGEIKIPDFSGSGVMDIAVPGDVNNTLLHYGRIPDPYYDTQARECYWVSSKEWWYKLEFDVLHSFRGEAELNMTGVDGHTDIWLNGTYLGGTENAFRLFKFKVKDVLRKNGNTLIIRFKALDSLLGGPRLDPLGGWKGRRAFLRKPQFNFGWDWALPLPSIGLAGDVWLELDNGCRLVDFSVQTFTDGRVDFSFEVSEQAKNKGYQLRTRLEGYGTNLEQVISPHSYRSYTSFKIPNPKLWYPNGYGEQSLYRYTAELIMDGHVVDLREGRAGLREVRTVERPFTADAGPGFSFWIEVNGIPVFCKGANWIPMEIWPGTIEEEDYEFYLKKAGEANFNMLRVWGGGIYEAEKFYELCDQLGIMVWEDFMFASTGYPVDVLKDEIIAEADYQLRRLHNHASIVLWCGCNEDVHSWSYKSDKPAAQQDTGVYSEVDESWSVNRAKDDPQIYTMILRGMTGRYGLGVPYIESSPQSRDDSGNTPNSGNCHISCWKYSLLGSGGKYAEFRKHFENVCSFDSEFCIQGPCSVKTLTGFLAPENHWPPNDAWVYHIQKGHANLPHHEQTMRIAGAIFGEIDCLQKYVKYGQATHVEMMRAEFESARRDYPNNGGTMMWMYNDCWPTANWSIIDYYKRPKPSYYAAKRACAPLLPIIFERDGKIEFLFSNHTLKNVEVSVLFGQEKLDGSGVWEERRCVTVPSNTAVIFHTISRSQLNIPLGDFLFINAEADGEVLDRVTYFTDGWKEVEWPEPGAGFKVLGSSKNTTGWRYEVEVSTRRYARLCHILSNDEGVSMFASDNYFDLPAAVKHRLSIDTDREIEPSSLRLGHWLTEWE